MLLNLTVIGALCLFDTGQKGSLKQVFTVCLTYFTHSSNDVRQLLVCCTYVSC